MRTVVAVEPPRYFSLLRSVSIARRHHFGFPVGEDMERDSSSWIIPIILAAGLFILAGIFRQVDFILPPLTSAICFLMTNFLYIGLTFAWGISISRRSLHREVRKQLLLGCAMAVLWLILRAFKYRFFEEDMVTRHLWYLYYVPQILAPLFSFYASLQLGQREDAALPTKWYLLLIPAVLLIGGMLTNDLHQLAFGFSPNMVAWGSDYSHGPLYYLVMAWTVCFLLAAMGIIYHKCRVSESRRYTWIVLCVFLAGAALCFLSFLNLYIFHKMPECFCLTFIALWESCLQVGLLPTNKRYALRSQTIERVFADAKEKHAMRYTPYRGLTAVTAWVKLKFAAMNLKKLALHKWRPFLHFYLHLLQEASFLQCIVASLTV